FRRCCFFFSSRRRHTRFSRDWSSDVCSSDLISFEEALHTYLAVSDARTTTVVGLDGAPYLDKVTGGPDPVTQRGEVTFTGETDRVYLSAADVIVRDEGAARSIGVTKEGSANTVVWNPWVEDRK